MRKLIFAINITLDGCCDHTKGVPNEEVHAYFTHLMQDVDTLVYGRKTYQLMVPFWPDIAKDPSGQSKETTEFAQAFDAVKELIVCSYSLQKAEGKNTRIIRSNLPQEILKLKQQPGKDIATGGVDIPSQLLKLGLIDEFRIVVHPIVAGEGRRLFDDVILQAELQLKLIESKVFKSGHVALRYGKD